IKPFEERELQATIEMFFYKIDLEQKLKSSEFRLHFLFQKAHDGIIIIDEHKHILDINEVAINISGYKRSELLKTDYQKILPDLDMLAIREKDEKNQVIETFILNRSGNHIPVEISHSMYTLQNQRFIMLVFRDISDRIRNLEILKRRDQILEAVGVVAERLLANDQIDKAMNESLKYIGEATSADRCYIFKNVLNPQNELCMSLKYEWAHESVEPQSNNDLLQNLPYAVHTDEIYSFLSQNKIYKKNARDFNEAEKVILGGQNIQSLILVPISVDNAWWGFIGLDDCHGEKEWTPAEIEVLKGMAGIIGAAIQNYNAQLNIKKSEDKYRLLVDSIYDGIVISQNNQFIFYNKRFAEILGYEPDELHNINYRKIYSKRGLKILMHRFEKRQLGEKVPNRYETYFLKKDGKEIDVEVIVSIIEYEGNPATFAVIRDISEQKQAEQEINMLAHAIKSISEAVSVTDLDDRIIFVNNAFIKTYGYTRDELIGQHINIIRSEEMLKDSTLLESIRNGTLNGGGWQGEIVNRRKDGSIFPVMLSTSLLHDENGEVMASIGVARDISERKQAEKEIYQSRERLNIILHSIGNGVVVIDSHNRVIIHNEKARELLNLSDPLEPVPHLKDMLIHCEQHGKVLLDSLDTGAFSNLELIVTNPEHKILYVTGTTFEDVDGESAGKVFILQDVTKEREIDRMKTDFVSSVSHELRTPLTSIMGFSNTILRKEKMPEDIKKEFIEIIYNESKRLARLIEDVLSISKIESGKITFEMKPMNLDEVIQDAVTIYRTQAEDKQIDLTYEKDENLPEILGDRDALSQVIVNLISNALKFTPSKGNIDIRLKHKDNQIVLDVEDNGMGIPKNEQDKIFQKFYRIHRPGKQMQGTGLGLSIVKEIVEKHKGKIEIFSEENQGSLFRISLPVFES
ncbi:MAG: hypothetical protein DRP86_07855, partial [Candidatus Neomarinimicrobiota bacterium]